MRPTHNVLPRVREHTLLLVKKRHRKVQSVVSTFHVVRDVIHFERLFQIFTFLSSFFFVFGTPLLKCFIVIFLVYILCLGGGGGVGMEPNQK